jgi:hypothetical protein
MAYDSGQARLDLLDEVGDATDDLAISGLVARVGARVTWTQIQKLRRYGGTEGFTRAQG